MKRDWSQNINARNLVSNVPLQEVVGPPVHRVEARVRQSGGLAMPARRRPVLRSASARRGSVFRGWWGRPVVVFLVVAAGTMAVAAGVVVVVAESSVMMWSSVRPMLKVCIQSNWPDTDPILTISSRKLLYACFNLSDWLKSWQRPIKVLANEQSITLRRNFLLWSIIDVI